GTGPGLLAWIRPSVRPTPLTWKKLVPLPPQHGQLYWKSVPNPSWSVATPVPSPVLPDQPMLPLCRTLEVGRGDPSSGPSPQNIARAICAAALEGCAAP